MTTFETFVPFTSRISMDFPWLSQRMSDGAGRPWASLTARRKVPPIIISQMLMAASWTWVAERLMIITEILVVQCWEKIMMKTMKTESFFWTCHSLTSRIAESPAPNRKRGRVVFGSTSQMYDWIQVFANQVGLHVNHLMGSPSHSKGPRAPSLQSGRNG